MWEVKTITTKFESGFLAENTEKIPTPPFLYFKEAKRTSAALFKIPERLKLHPLFKAFLKFLNVIEWLRTNLEAKDILSFSTETWHHGFFKYKMHYEHHLGIGFVV